MKNQSRTIKTNPELYRVVMDSSGGHRRLPGGSDDFSLQTNRQTLHHNIYIIMSINVHHHIQSSSLSRNPKGGIVQSSSLCPIIMSINVHYHVQSSSSCPIIMSINVHHHIQSSSLSRNPKGGIVQSSSLCPIIMSINVHYHAQSSSSCPIIISINVHHHIQS